MRVIHCGRCNPAIDADRFRAELGRLAGGELSIELEDGAGNDADAYVLLGACPTECLGFEAPPGKPVIRVGGPRVDGWDVSEGELSRAVVLKLSSCLGKGKSEG